MQEEVAGKELKKDLRVLLFMCTLKVSRMVAELELIEKF